MLIYKEIINYEPDIICLEEVSHYKEFLEPNLKHFGYQGIVQYKDNQIKKKNSSIFFKKKK